jgi:porphobilinogen synthase
MAKLWARRDPPSLRFGVALLWHVSSLKVGRDIGFAESGFRPTKAASRRFNRLPTPHLPWLRRDLDCVMLELLRRPRRVRSNQALRQMVRENSLETRQLIYPMFVSEKVDKSEAISSMPGVYQYSVNELVENAKQVFDLGIPAILLFGIPRLKDELGSQAFDPNGIVQSAVRHLKKSVPDLLVITDVCLCEYTSHGHCGIVDKRRGGFEVLNDRSVEVLVQTAVSQAEAGTDVVAPSDMMDGRVGAIRSGLDQAGFSDLPIMSYAAKFCSAFYGPFREAAESAPQFGDRQSYQMDPANADEALREVELDIEEGADLIIVKPGLPYLDILWRVKERFGLPTAVYNISGEYAMLKAAAVNGWIDEKRAVLEITTGFRRAGADMVITYWAKDLASWLK